LYLSFQILAMLRQYLHVWAFIFGSICLVSWCKPDIWGFYGHRLINRMAVYTLPTELIGFYKKHIDYMAEHAIDPDKRRYATKHEAVRHYIDIDMWDTIPFLNVPRDFESAIIKHAKLYGLIGTDTFTYVKTITTDSIFLINPMNESYSIKSDYKTFLKFWKNVIKPQYYEDTWIVNGYDIDDAIDQKGLGKAGLRVLIEDHFSEHGICPYFLEEMMGKLTRAFEKKDYELILRYSAEFGHYIADAHVPLHTTSNYNGQLTDQVGIHAFWESRIPELFAEREYDFFVGKAIYIEDQKSYFWNIITKAHSHLDSVLLVEKRLSKTYEQDQQFCFDERLGTTIRIQCPEYTDAYTKALGDMVEEQMRSAIHAVGSCIYTCWANAGQPSLKNVLPVVFKTQEDYTPDPNVKTRTHDN
jgi:hypothetical protein